MLLEAIFEVIVMPNEIIPMHKLEQFDGVHDSRLEMQIPGLSDLQVQMLGGQRQARNTFSENVLEMLDSIAKHEDVLLSATDTIVAQAGVKTKRASDTVYRVPASITDNDLIGLKAQGLVQGNSRAVKFTDLGKVALRDYWLKSSNSMLKERTKNMHVVERRASKEETQVKTSRFTRIDPEA